MTRLDTPAKVDGTAEFGIDVKLPGMLVRGARAVPGARRQGRELRRREGEGDARREARGADHRRRRGGRRHLVAARRARARRVDDQVGRRRGRER